MPVYKYKAIDSNNNIIEGDVKTNNLEEARQAVAEKGLTLIRVEESKKLSDFKINLSNGISINNVIFFCRELSIIIKSGINLTIGLDILKKQSVKGLRETIHKIDLEVQKGRTLAQAMRDSERKFPDLLVKMITTGEASGNLDDVLENMAEYYERESFIRQKVRGAMVYPTVLIVVCIALIVFFAQYILPDLVDLMEGQKLPAITLFTINSTKLLVSWYTVAFMGLLLAAIIIAKLVVSDRKFRHVKDLLILKIPIIGEVIKGMITIRFTRTLYLLIKSGLDIVNVLEIIKRIMSNSIAEDAIEFALDGIKRGEKMGTMLTINKFFDPLIIQMITIGEETGELEKILHEVTIFYQKKLEMRIEKMVTLIEPAFTLVIGILIGFVIVSMALPIMSMAGNMSQPGGGVNLE